MDIGTNYSHKIKLKIRFQPPYSCFKHIHYILHEKHREGEDVGVNHGFIAP